MQVLCLGLLEKENEENRAAEFAEYNSESDSWLFEISIAQCLEFWSEVLKVEIKLCVPYPLNIIDPAKGK
jgi:hypothetical protein